MNGNTLMITNTPGAIINWQQFSIQQNEITRFIQQNAASTVLNRVTGGNPSAILGQLLSNGRVFLINPSGIAFGKGAIVDVAGLTASTLNISDADFASGRMRFAGAGTEGKLTNAGTLRTAEGGHVYLIAPNVENQAGGVISTPKGEVVIAAGKTVELVNSQTPDIHVEFNAPANEAVNAGEIVAASGRIGVYGTLIRNSGVVSASRAVVGDGGKIVFKAVKDVTLDASSRIEANGAKGGDVTIQAETGTLLAQGVIEAKGAEQKGGEIRLLAKQVGLIGNAEVDASGARGGGSVLIGGDFHGDNADVPNAQRAYVGPDAVIRADAVEEGDGGKVVVWADGDTRYYGSISARGGELGGDGGKVEVSGKHSLVFRGNVDTRAPKGRTGSLLLDPDDIVIKNLAADDPAAPNDTDVAGGQILFADGPGGTGTFTISAGKLESLSAATDIKLEANNTITMEALTAPNVLTDATLTLGQTGSVSMTTTNGLIDLGAGNTINLTGGGSFSLSAGTSITTGAIVSKGGAVTLTGGTAASGIITTAAITTTGANGGVGAPGGIGGDGGAVLISNANGGVSAQAITTTGGMGGAGAAPDDSGGKGGNAGTITISATGAISTSNQALIANGGKGGAADGVLATSGAGGDGKAISVSSSGAGITVGAISNVGGAAGDVTGGAAPGAQGQGDTIALNAAGLLALNGTIDALNKAVSLTGNGVALAANKTVTSGTGPLTVDARAGVLTLNSGSLLLGTGTVSLTADDMALDATSQVGGTGAGMGSATTVTLKQSTNGQQIDLGTDTGGKLGLTGAELDTVHASTLKIGDANSGDLSITAAISPATAPTLSLQTGGTISQTAGSTITATGLALRSAGATTLTEANAVTTLAASVTGSASAFQYTGTGAVDVGTVDSLDGISTNGGAVALISGAGGAGNLTLSKNVNTTVGNPLGANVNLTALGATSDVTVNATVTSGSGAISVNAGQDALLGASALTTGNGTAGAVSVVAGRDILDTSGADNTAGTANIQVTGDNAGVTLTAGRDIGAAATGRLDVAYGGTGSDLVLDATGNYQLNLLRSGGTATLDTLTVTARANTTQTIDFDAGLGLTSYTVGTTATDTTLTNVSTSGIDFSYTAATGDLNVGVVDAGATGNVALTSTAGAIADANGAANNVTAASLTASALTGINLDTTITTLTSANVTGLGAIDIRNSGALTVTSATTNDGAITLAADNGTLILTTVSAGGTGSNVTASTTTAGDIAVGSVSAAGGQVSLTAVGAITDANGGANNVTASSLTATAGAGINLDTTITTLTSANVSGTGAIDIRNSGALTVTSATTTDGAITLAADNGTLTLRVTSPWAASRPRAIRCH